MILFFDTETTGLPKNWKAPVTDLENWPRLVQLAYLVYDFDGNLIHSCNEIIKPNGFTIPSDASKVHGITTDVANQRGSKIEDVFELFSIHLKRAKVIVAHNMAYDEKIIGSELIRMGLVNTLDSKEKICTMESTVNLCKIDGPYGYKWPKLEELHRFLFKHDFDGAHDALADIQATAKCFWELSRNYSNLFFSFQKYNEQSQKFNPERSIEDEIIFAVKNKKRLKIRYRNFDEIISERILSNVEFSENVLSKEELECFQIDSKYITAYCSIRNETRTFKISRIIEATVINETTPIKNNSQIKIPTLIPSTLNGVKNVIDSTTFEIVLLENRNYDKVKFFNYFNNNTLLLEKKGKFGFYNRKTNYILLDWYDEIEKIDENYAIVTVNKKQRILNLSNPVKINDYCFDRINVRTERANYQFEINYDVNNQKAIVENFGKWGIINFENEILLDLKFNYIRLLDNELLLISRSGKWGLFDLRSLSWTIELIYEEYVSYNIPFLILKNKNNCILFNIQTYSIVFESYPSILFKDEYFLLIDFNYQYGIYDPNREYTSDCKWEFITDYDGRYIYFEKYHKKGCFDTYFNLQIADPIYDSFSRFLVGYSKVEINKKPFFLSDNSILEELFLPRIEGAITEDYGPLTVYQIDEESVTIFKIYIGNVLVKNINFKRFDNSRGKSKVKIELIKSNEGDDIFFSILEMVDWNWDKYGKPRFYPKQFFSLYEDNINQNIYYSGSEIEKNSWKIANIFVKKEAEKKQYNNYLTLVEDTNWRIEDNSKNDDPTKIFFKDELRFEFHAEEVKFGPFINGITELDVCYWADHEGYAGDYFGFVDIHGNHYFDYDIKDSSNDKFDDCDNNSYPEIDSDDLPF